MLAASVTFTWTVLLQVFQFKEVIYPDFYDRFDPGHLKVTEEVLQPEPRASNVIQAGIGTQDAMFKSGAKPAPASLDVFPVFHL